MQVARREEWMKTEMSSRKDARWCGHERGKVAAMAGCCQLPLFLGKPLLSHLTSELKITEEKSCQPRQWVLAEMSWDTILAANKQNHFAHLHWNTKIHIKTALQNFLKQWFNYLSSWRDVYQKMTRFQNTSFESITICKGGSPVKTFENDVKKKVENN